jgi:transcriptional regulator with GAF, ATPase, and Fis domain
MSIGRDSTNWICISDLSASRKHCLITRSNDSFQLSDLDSRNGSSINGIPIHERILQHGDQIEFGESVFLFLIFDEESTPALLNGENLAAIPTTRLRLEDALYLQPQRLLNSTLPTGRTIQGLESILKLSRTIQTLHESEILFQKILESIFSITPAQRGAVVLTRSESNEVRSIHMYDRNLLKMHTGVSKTIVEMVMKERLGFLSNNVQRDSRIQAAQNSLTALKVSSLIAVPLICANLIQGVLYLDTGDSGVRFDEDHLQLISAIATIGAGAVESVRQFETLQEDHEQVIQSLRIQHNMIGETAVMKDLFRMIGKISPSNSTVVISGETGTGKELVARAIHLNSSRSGKSFVAINCANLSESLLESELFGHEKGAFTGAYAQKKGKMELADGGTLFLDEIGELPLSLQSKILRVLQEREFERVGGIRTLKVDVRFLVATNKDLETSVRSGTFRQDLFYRLNVVRIHLPPLRERREDIPLLASYFASRYAEKCNPALWSGQGDQPRIHEWKV